MGCLVNETDFQEAIFWGDSSISEEDYVGDDPYIAADSLEDLFLTVGEKDNFQGYLLILVNGKAQTPETAVTLPDTLGNIPVKGIAIMAYWEGAPLSVNRFAVNAPFAVRGVVDGNLELLIEDYRGGTDSRFSQKCEGRPDCIRVSYAFGGFQYLSGEGVSG